MNIINIIYISIKNSIYNLRIVYICKNYSKDTYLSHEKLVSARGPRTLIRCSSRNENHKDGKWKSLIQQNRVTMKNIALGRKAKTTLQRDNATYM